MYEIIIENERRLTSMNLNNQTTVKHRTKSALKELKTLLEGEEKNER